MDKIVGVWQGSISATTSGTATNIPHGLPFAPLLFGRWSTTSDFASSRDFGVLLYGSPSLDSIDIYANSANIVMTPLVSSNKTLYYRVYAFAPADDKSDLSPTVAGNLQFNSDNNYMKLFVADKVTLTSSVQNIYHNLGYLPLVMLWNENSNGVFPFNVDVWDPASATCVVTNTALQVQLGNLETGILHYRIYYDQAQ
jgi:hypothetical protein